MYFFKKRNLKIFYRDFIKKAKNRRFFFFLKMFWDQYFSAAFKEYFSKDWDF